MGPRAENQSFSSRLGLSSDQIPSWSPTSATSLEPQALLAPRGLTSRGVDALSEIRAKDQILEQTTLPVLLTLREFLSSRSFVPGTGVRFYTPHTQICTYNKEKEKGYIYILLFHTSTGNTGASALGQGHTLAAGRAASRMSRYGVSWI